jgi:hypothetical protein
MTKEAREIRQKRNNKLFRKIKKEFLKDEISRRFYQ